MLTASSSFHQRQAPAFAFQKGSPFVRVVPRFAEVKEIESAEERCDYGMLACRFIKSLNTSGVTALPVTRVELHKEHRYVFRRWAESLHINTKIYHLILSEYERIVREQNEEARANSLTESVASEQMCLGKKVIDGLPMEKFYPHLAHSEATGDSLSTILRLRKVNVEKVSSRFTLLKDANPGNKKSNIAGFVLYGAREMLHVQKYKGKSIPLDELIKRMVCFYRDKGEGNIFGKHERRILAIARRHQFEFWL